MESPDSPYNLSPNRSSADDAPVNSEDDEKATYIKFLVSNASAGSVIGKGGSTITEFQTQSGTRIQLSRNQEYFPGTSDRIVMISGNIDQILKAVELILNKLLGEIPPENSDDVDVRSRLRLVVPNSCCGAIIGKGGATIKSFIEESQAGIKISPQDNGYIGLSDRLVTLTGSFEEQMCAIDLILSKLSEDPHYLQSHAHFSYPGISYAGVHHGPYPYALLPVAAAPYHAVHRGPSNDGRKFQNNKAAASFAIPLVWIEVAKLFKEDRNNSVTIGVADERIGVVLGRGGRNIAEISQTSGARIKISDKGDFISGTSDRKVTITGSQRAIRIAEDMIEQKVASVTER